MDDVLAEKQKIDILCETHQQFEQPYEDKIFGQMESVVEALVQKDKINSNAFIQKKATVKNR